MTSFRRSARRKSMEMMKGENVDGLARRKNVEGDGHDEKKLPDVAGGNSAADGSG